MSITFNHYIFIFTSVRWGIFKGSSTSISGMFPGTLIQRLPRNASESPFSPWGVSVLVVAVWTWKTWNQVNQTKKRYSAQFTATTIEHHRTVRNCLQPHAYHSTIKLEYAIVLHSQLHLILTSFTPLKVFDMDQTLLTLCFEGMCDSFQPTTFPQKISSPNWIRSLRRLETQRMSISRASKAPPVFSLKSSADCWTHVRRFQGTTKYTSSSP